MTVDIFSGKFQEKLSAVKGRLKGGKIMYERGLSLPKLRDGEEGDNGDGYNVDDGQDPLEKRKNYQEVSCQAIISTVCEDKTLAIILFNDDKSEAYSYGIDNANYLKILRDAIDKILTGKGDFEKIYA